MKHCNSVKNNKYEFTIIENYYSFISISKCCKSNGIDCSYHFLLLVG